MLDGQSFALGMGLLIIGLVFVLGVWFVLRVVPRVKPAEQLPAQFVATRLQEQEDAILIVQTGGRIT
jgi:hypothetical protein